MKSHKFMQIPLYRESQKNSSKSPPPYAARILDESRKNLTNILASGDQWSGSDIEIRARIHFFLFFVWGTNSFCSLWYRCVSSFMVLIDSFHVQYGIVIDRGK